MAVSKFKASWHSYLRICEESKLINNLPKQSIFQFCMYVLQAAGSVVSSHPISGQCQRYVLFRCDPRALRIQPGIGTETARQRNTELFEEIRVGMCE